MKYFINGALFSLFVCLCLAGAIFLIGYSMTWLSHLTGSLELAAFIIFVLLATIAGGILGIIKGENNDM